MAHGCRDILQSASAPRSGSNEGEAKVKIDRVAKHALAIDNPLSFTTAIVCGVVGAVLFVAGAQAADAITSKVDVTPAANKFTAADWRAVSLGANRILMHVAEALDALAEKKNDQALANIEKGTTLTNILNGVVPGATVKTEITGAGITYKDETQVKPKFVPIYREYDMVDTISRVTSQKQISHADKSASTKAPRAPEFSYVGLDYSDVKLDLRLAHRDLLAAQHLLKAGDTAAAQLTLQDIENNGVIFEFSATRMPLARAMDNLRLAESELKNNHPDQAKAALGAATDALKNYETVTGAKDVKQLQEQINEVANNIGRYNPESFSKKVSEWWDKVVDWLGKAG
jgi:hypothetical protein